MGQGRFGYGITQVGDDHQYLSGAAHGPPSDLGQMVAHRYGAELASRRGTHRRERRRPVADMAL